MTHESHPASPLEANANQLDALLDSMTARRDVLLGILLLCETPRPLEDISAEVERLQENNASVFTAAGLCMALENAGGLERVADDGRPYAEIDLEPRVVEDESGSHYDIPETPALFWHTTEQGRRVLASDDPASEARALLFGDERAYLSVYRTILAMCDTVDGCSTKHLGDAVDGDPLLKEPRLFAGHFIEKLERVRCLRWTGDGWKTTETGRDIASELAR